METEPHSEGDLEIPAVVFRQYLIGMFSVGVGAPGNMTMGHIVLRLTQHGIEAPDAGKDGKALPIVPTFPVRSWGYGEVKSVQVFKSPYWTKWHFGPVPPSGTRIHFGESRSPLLVFTDQQTPLLDGLERHGVSVNREPIRLNPLLVGRK